MSDFKTPRHNSIPPPPTTNHAWTAPTITSTKATLQLNKHKLSSWAHQTKPMPLHHGHWRCQYQIVIHHCTASTLKISRQGNTPRRLTPGWLCPPAVCYFVSIVSSWEIRLCWLFSQSVILPYLPIINRRTQNGWIITGLDPVLLTKTRAMPRSSAIGVARAWAHLVYHQLVRRGRSTTLQWSP